MPKEKAAPRWNGFSFLNQLAAKFLQQAAAAYPRTPQGSDTPLAGSAKDFYPLLNFARFRRFTLVATAE